MYIYDSPSMPLRRKVDQCCWLFLVYLSEWLLGPSAIAYIILNLKVGWSPHPPLWVSPYFIWVCWSLVLLPTRISFTIFQRNCCLFPLIPPSAIVSESALHLSLLVASPVPYCTTFHSGDCWLVPPFRRCESTLHSSLSVASPVLFPIGCTTFQIYCWLVFPSAQRNWSCLPSFQFHSLSRYISYFCYCSTSIVLLGHRDADMPSSDCWKGARNGFSVQLDVKQQPDFFKSFRYEDFLFFYTYIFIM